MKDLKFFFIFFITSASAQELSSNNYSFQNSFERSYDENLDENFNRSYDQYYGQFYLNTYTKFHDTQYQEYYKYPHLSDYKKHYRFKYKDYNQNHEYKNSFKSFEESYYPNRNYFYRYDENVDRMPYKYKNITKHTDIEYSLEDEKFNYELDNLLDGEVFEDDLPSERVSDVISEAGIDDLEDITNLIDHESIAESQKYFDLKINNNEMEFFDRLSKVDLENDDEILEEFIYNDVNYDYYEGIGTAVDMYDGVGRMKPDDWREDDGIGEPKDDVWTWDNDGIGQIGENREDIDYEYLGVPKSDDWNEDDGIGITDHGKAFPIRDTETKYNDRPREVYGIRNNLEEQHSISLETRDRTEDNISEIEGIVDADDMLRESELEASMLKNGELFVENLEHDPDYVPKLDLYVENGPYNFDFKEHGIDYDKNLYRKRELIEPIPDLVDKKFYALKIDANNGSGWAQYEVGMTYIKGKIVKRNIDEGIAFLKRAAMNDHYIAQMNLGHIYSFKEFNKKNTREAVKWYYMAAKKGRVKAQVRLADLYLKDDQIPKNSDLAVKWYRFAANHGSGEAMYKLGEIYARANGVKQNLEESYSWLALAKNYGNNKAKGLLSSVESSLNKNELDNARYLASRIESEFNPVYTHLNKVKRIRMPASVPENKK